MGRALREQFGVAADANFRNNAFLWGPVVYDASFSRDFLSRIVVLQLASACGRRRDYASRSTSPCATRTQRRCRTCLTISAATILVYHVVAELSGAVPQLARHAAAARNCLRAVDLGLYRARAAGRRPVDAVQRRVFVHVETGLDLHDAGGHRRARIVLRKVQQRLRARGFNTRRYAVCGVNELGIQLARNIERSPEMGLRLAGFLRRPADGSHGRHCRTSSARASAT